MNRRNFFTGIAGIAASIKGVFGFTAKAPTPTSNDILKSFDARDWAKYFVEHVHSNPSIATDEETMTTWFANSLMRGYDEGFPAGKNAQIAEDFEQMAMSVDPMNTPVAVAELRDERDLAVRTLGYAIPYLPEEDPAEWDEEYTKFKWGDKPASTRLPSGIRNTYIELSQHAVTKPWIKMPYEGPAA